MPAVLRFRQDEEVDAREWRVLIQVPLRGGPNNRLQSKAALAPVVQLVSFFVRSKSRPITHSARKFKISPSNKSFIVSSLSPYDKTVFAAACRSTASPAGLNRPLYGVSLINE